MILYYNTFEALKQCCIEYTTLKKINNNIRLSQHTVFTFDSNRFTRAQVQMYYNPLKML